MRPRLHIGLILLALFVGFAGPVPSAFAKDDEHSKSKTDEHGTPNPVAVDLTLAIASIIVFIGLLLILRKLAWGPMLEGLQKREDNIRFAADEAKLVREASVKAQGELQAKLDEAYAEIPRMMEEARRDAETMREDMRSQAAKEIQTERVRLRREIDTARDQALQDIWNQAAQLATAISSKVLVKIMTPDDHNRLFNLALEEMKGSGDRYREEFLKN
jgi:F-type H+-transporting ATPase subunit b